MVVVFLGGGGSGRAPLCFTFSDQMDQTVACSLRLSSPLSSGILPPLLSAGQTRLNSGSLGGQTASLPRGSTQNAFQRVHLILLLCVCVSDSRTATYCVVLVFAFEKAATVSLIFVQQRVCVRVCARMRVCVRLWTQGSGKSSFHFTIFSFMKFIPFYFSSVALYSPSQGFITKQVIHIHTVKWGDGVGKVRCIFCLLSLHFLFLTMLLPVVTLQIIQMRYAQFPYQRPGELDTTQALKFFAL